MPKKEGSLLTDGTAQHGGSPLQQRTGRDSYASAAAKLGQYAHEASGVKSTQQTLLACTAKTAKNGPPVKTPNTAQHVPEKMAPAASRNAVSNPPSPLPAQVTADPTDVENREPSLQDILTAVHAYGSSITDLSTEVKGMKEGLLHIRQDMQKIRERATALEGRVSSIEDELPPLAQEMHITSNKADESAARIEDMENRLRRSNIRIVGMPEKSEGKHPAEFIEAWLADTFGKNNLTPFFSVERAHRVPSRPPPPGGNHRPFILKLLHYKDRDIILRLARQKTDMDIQGSKVSIYPDFSAAVQKQRAKFTEVKKRMRAIPLVYSMLYPAKLRVVADGTVHFFESPNMAASWLDRHERRLRGADQGHAFD